MMERLVILGGFDHLGARMACAPLAAGQRLVRLVSRAALAHEAPVFHET